jgi:outer membrane protein assembly factor BamA
MRTPETGWGYGASGNITFRTTHRKDSLTRTSSIDAFGIWTQRGQNIQGLNAIIYLPQEKFILYLQSSHSYFPDRFWGIGPNTEDHWSERYLSDQFNISLHIKRKIARKFFAGFWYNYQNVFRIGYDSLGVFDTVPFFGKSPYQISGAGVSLSYDTRNAAFWPTKGLFIQTYVQDHDKGIGSDFNFIKWVVDVRFFQKIVLDHVLAFQLYSYTTLGQTPFRSLASFGGSENIRGFYQGRFRDNNMMTLIAEYRAPIISRISLVAFGGIGNVYNNLNDWKSSSLKYSFGGGLRLSLLERDRLNIRVDYGYHSPYNSGFYFTIGESF